MKQSRDDGSTARATLGAEEQLLLRHLSAIEPASIGVLWSRVNEGKKWGRSTVQKMMDRLLKKDVVQREQVDGVYRYKVKRQIEDIDVEVVRQFVDSRFDGNVSPLVTFLDGGTKLSPQEVARLRKIIEDWEATS